MKIYKAKTPLLTIEAKLAMLQECTHIKSIEGALYSIHTDKDSGLYLKKEPIESDKEPEGLAEIFNLEAIKDLLASLDVDYSAQDEEDEGRETVNQDDGDDLTITEKNIVAIDTLIFNTLHQKDNVTGEQADTLIKLAQLKIMLLSE